MSSKLTQKVFDVKNISLVPTFRESEVDSYFSAFEKMATDLNWPKDMWPILLQCKLVGKTQKVVSSLSLEQSMKYEVLKETILHAYELVPEAYRQKFRNHKKSNSQTFVGFAHEKVALFDKWCAANEVNDNFESLHELMLLEDFKSSLPERLIMFFYEQKVTLVSKAAVLADEFVLTHKNVFSPTSRSDKTSKSCPARFESSRPSSPVRPVSPPQSELQCFYCHKKGQLIADCSTLKRKQPPSASSQPKGVGLIKVKSDIRKLKTENYESDPCFKPFMLGGICFINWGSKRSEASENPERYRGLSVLY